MTKPNRDSHASIHLTDAQIAAARQAGEALLNSDFHAAQAWYEAERNLIWITTTAGTHHGIPAEQLQGLSGATPEQLGDIEISPQGSGLHWPQLDADLTVRGIIFGVYGSKVWMAELGRKGGQRRSAEKAAAARANGRKGGRPRKSESKRSLVVAEDEASYSAE